MLMYFPVLFLSWKEYILLEKFYLIALCLVQLLSIRIGKVTEEDTP